MTDDHAIEAHGEPGAESRWAFLGWSGFALLLFYAVVIGGGWMGLYVGPIRMFDLIVISIGLAVWLMVAWRRPGWRPTTAIWPAFVAVLAAFGLSLLASSYQRLGLEFLAYAVLLTALYLLLVRIMALPYARARIGGLIAAIALVMGATYVIWSVLLWVEWWGLLGEFQLPPFRPTHLGMTWGSPSVVLTVQVLMTTAAIGGIGFASRSARGAVIVLVSLLAMVAVISGSRSGWLSLAGTLAVVGVLALLDARGRELLSRGLSDRRLRLALVPLGIAVVIVGLIFGPAMLDRFAGYGDGGRPTYWATALRMFEDTPLLGQGPGTWMVRRTAFTQPGELDLYQPHAHSQYLQTGAELGLVGLIAGLIAFAAVAWLLYRAMRSGNALRRRWAWASIFGLVYLALNVVVDVHTIPTVALLVGIPIAVLDATSDRVIGLPGALRTAAGPLRTVAIVALLVSSAVALGYLFRAESVAMTHQQAVLAAKEGEWSDVLQPALDAAAAEPDNAAYQMTAALASAAAGDWGAAESSFANVTVIDDLPTAWLGLANAQVQLQRPADEVADSVQRALRLGSQQASLTLAAGQLYDDVGMLAEADDAYARTLRLMPSLASDPDWQAELGTQRFASLVDATIATTPHLGWELALMSGDEARARELASERGDSERLLRFIDAWGGDAQAVAQVQATADASPMNPQLLAYAARVSAQVGDDEGVQRYRRLASLGPFYGPPTVNATYGLRDPEVDAGMGASTYYYGTYTYRRALPIDLLVPGRPGLTLGLEAEDDDS